MSSIYKQFETDKRIEGEGIILNFGKTESGVNIDIKIARAGGGNTRFAKIAETIMKPHRRQIANESIDPKLLEELMIKIYAKAVVIGWTGMEDKEGALIPFSEDNVVKVFTDLPDLFSNVREAAEKNTLFRIEALEIEAKN